MSTLEASPDGWYLSDADGTLRYANPAYRTLLGLGSGDTAPTPASLGGVALPAQPGARRLNRRLANGERCLLVLSRETPAWSIPGVADAWRLHPLGGEVAAAAARLVAMPFALFLVDRNGYVLAINDQAADLLGGRRDALLDGEIRLADIIQPARDRNQPGTGLGDPAPGQLIVTIQGADKTERTARLSWQKLAEGDSSLFYGLLEALPERNTEAGTARGHAPALFEQAPIGIAKLDVDGRVLESNDAVGRFLEPEDGILVGRTLWGLLDEQDRAEVENALRAIRAGERGRMPIEVRSGRKRERVASLYASRVTEANGTVSGLIVHLIDTTEQKTLELHFAQAQKMQAIGQLAGGIAHDFNNLLTAIIGFCDLLLMRHQAGDHSFADIMQIKQNASRAANLVRQLLAFSRQQTLKPTVLSVTDVLAELSNLIRRLIGETLEFQVIHGRDVAFIKADQGQLEQVIVNLAVNARDAMLEGGRLTIRTRNVARQEVPGFGHDLLPSADYVLIEVVDTGVGIPKEHIGKIFEPFFTTKGVGAGTGLGLSTVYGIVKQFGGYIFCDSAIGQGARFSIFLPQITDQQPERPVSPMEESKLNLLDLTGRGTILLVEDETAVRMFGARALRNKGYTVLEADSGEAALELIRSAKQSIDLLITDVVMPRLDGPGLTKQVRAKLPDLKVIYISGYAEDAFRSSVGGDINFLPKPFSLRQLASKVKEVLTEDAPVKPGPN